MTNNLNWEKLVPENKISGEDANETKEILGVLSDAKNYICSHKWCPAISEAYIGIGVGSVLGVFLFRFAKKIGDDDLLWVIGGDIPFAYLVVDEANEPASALAIYCSLMDDWVNAVLNGKSVEECFPVNAPADKEHAEMLKSRLEFIREQIIPAYSDGWPE
jgi:hypothetical protein